MAALVAACGTWPSGFGGWMPPWWPGGHPRGTTGPGPAQGRRAATPWRFPCSHRPRPPEPVTTPPRACGVLGASLAKQTHPRPLSISAMPPSPVSPLCHPALLAPVPHPHVPLWQPKEGLCPPCSRQRCCHPLRWPWHPRTRGDAGQVLPGSAGSCNLGRESRGTMSPSCGQGDPGAAGTSPGRWGRVRGDEVTAGSGGGG